MDEACKLPVCEYQLNSFYTTILGSELEDPFELFVRYHSLEKALAASSESGAAAMETLSALAVGLGCFAGLQHLRPGGQEERVLEDSGPISYRPHTDPQPAAKAEL